MGKASAKQEVNEYYMSIHLGLCMGLDGITGIFVGEKLAWEGAVLGQANISVYAPNLFGGTKSNGGVGGIAVYLPGGDTQVMPAALAARLGLTPDTCPAYRGIASLFFIGTDDVPAGSVDVSGSGGLVGSDGSGGSGSGGDAGVGGGSGSGGGGTVSQPGTAIP